MHPVLLQWPRVSVIVPVYNRSQLLAQCLASLCAQNYPRDSYEIIVIDDGSTDESAEVARAIGQIWNGELHIISQANGGPSSARNAGITASKADMVAFTDSDCTAAPDWLDSLVSTYNATQADGVGGPIINNLPHTWVAEYLLATHFFRHRERKGIVDYLVTANVIFKRASLVTIGGFTARKGVWGEDADLSFRLKQSGYSLALSPTGAVTHYGTPISLGGLITELYRYGRGNAILSGQWHNHRTPMVELARHGAAALLAPLLALRLAKAVGLAKALSFWPIIVTEHLAFCWGLVNGMRIRGTRDA